MRNVNRHDRVTLDRVQDGELFFSKHNVLNPSNEVVYNHLENYAIYFKNAEFLKDGNVTGEYLGEVDVNKFGDVAKEIYYLPMIGWVFENQMATKAILASYENKDGDFKVLIRDES